MRRAPALVLALTLAACSRPPPPSADYAEARRRHAAIVAAHPGDAAARPEMDEVVALLSRVPPDSADAAAAAELRARIDADRKAVAAEEERRRELVERATQPTRAPAGSSSGSASSTTGETVRLGPGAKLDDLRAQAGDCFERKGEVELVEGDRKRSGEAWGLKDAPGCAAKHPAQVAQWLLFADGAYVTTRPSTEATTRVVERPEPRVEQFEAVPLPGGGYARKLPDGRLEPLPEGAKVERVEAPAPPKAGAR